MNKKCDLLIQHNNALLYYYQTSCIEANIPYDEYNLKNIDKLKYAIFPIKHYNKIKALDKTKIFDFCFIGSLSSLTTKNKLWIIPFVKRMFTENSIFLNTDKPSDWNSLGIFDLTNQTLNFNLINVTCNYETVDEHLIYYSLLKSSLFCLCPVSSMLWDFTFYDIIMCESIPILESGSYIYRTKEEHDIEYKIYFHLEFYTTTDIDLLIDEEKTIHNINLFNKYNLITPIITTNIDS